VIHPDFDKAGAALAAGSADDLTAILTPCFRKRSESRHLDAWVRFALDPQAEPPETNPQMAFFVETVRRMRRAAADGSPVEPSPRRRVIGRDFDFIGEPSNVESWSPIQLLNHLMLAQIVPTRKAAVVCPMRDDGIFAIEWIAHHLALGFHHAFIYTNDNADGSELLLRRLADHGVITLMESETDGQVRPELKAFEHAVQLLPEARDFEWLLFVDSDEFLMLGPQHHHNVDKMLSALAARYPDQLPAAILYEWLWYISGMVFEKRSGLLIERFQHARPHWLTKSLVRVADLITMRPQHHPELKPDRLIVDSQFEPFDMNKVWERRPPCYEGGWIAHYWPKSFEEFSLKKARGDNLAMENNEYQRDFGLFFQWNGIPTRDNHFPLDPAFAARVKQKAAELRELDGVAAAELEVGRRFRALLSRYDDVGGLERIYEASRTEPEVF
jgi:hypothetical protein